MRPQPDPRIVDHLCKEYQHASRRDIVSCWNNAETLWREIPPPILAAEPMELTAARALFVHGTLCDDNETRAGYWHGFWSLVMPYIPPRR